MKEHEIKKVLLSCLPEDKAQEATNKIMDVVFVTYTYTLDDLDVSTLRKFWKHVVDCDDYKINVDQIPDLSKGERLRMTQLRFFALIAKVKDEKGKQKANMWLLTKRGADFLGGLTIVGQIRTRDNKVMARNNSYLVNIKDFRHLTDFGPHYEMSIHEDIIKQLPLI